MEEFSDGEARIKEEIVLTSQGCVKVNYTVYVDVIEERNRMLCV